MNTKFPPFYIEIIDTIMRHPLGLVGCLVTAIAAWKIAGLITACGVAR